MLTTATNAAAHAATKKAQTTVQQVATTQLKKGFFRQRSAMEVVMKGGSGRASEAIFGLQTSKKLKVYGVHVDNLICDYCEIFSPYYEGDDAPVPQLRLFEVQRDRTQWAPFQFFWPRTQKVSNAQPLNNLTEILRSPTDAAVYDFFKSMQARDPELTKQKGETSNPITVASYIIPVVVDRISSITDSKLLMQLYTALSTFCERLYIIGEKYYGTRWTKDPYIVEFLKCNRKFIRRFSTESIKNYRVPSIDEFVPELFTTAGIICVELQNIVRNFIPGQIIRSDINTPRCVGVSFDILHARGATVNEQFLIQEANSFPEVDAGADKRITKNTEEFIEFAMRADTNAERFIQYVFDLASDKPDQERGKRKSRLLDSIIRRLDQQEEFIRLEQGSYPALFEEKTILAELKSSKRFTSLVKKERRRILKHVKQTTIPEMSKLFIKSIQFYRECVAMENAMRALKFYVEDSKSAVFTPNVKDFIEYLNSLYSRLTAFTQELVWFSANEYFSITEKNLMVDNLKAYSGFIAGIIEQARNCRNKISEAITLANSNTTVTSIRRTRKNNLTSDRLKVFDISLHMLLCFNRAYPSYNVEHLVGIREKIWGQYAWSKVKSDSESVAANAQNGNDLQAMCKKLKKFNGNKKPSHGHRRKDSRRTVRRNTSMINLQDGGETDKVVDKIQQAAKKYDNYSMKNRDSIGMIFTGSHSDTRIQKANDEARRIAELSRKTQNEIDRTQLEAVNIIKKLYHAITLIIEESSKEKRSFGQFVSDEFLGSGSNSLSFKKYYAEHQRQKEIKKGNKQDASIGSSVSLVSIDGSSSEEKKMVSESEPSSTSSEEVRAIHSDSDSGNNRSQSEEDDAHSDEESSYYDDDSNDFETKVNSSRTTGATSHKRASARNPNTYGSARDRRHNDDSRHSGTLHAVDSRRTQDTERVESNQKKAPKKTKKKKRKSFQNVLFKQRTKKATAKQALKKRASSCNDTSGDEGHHHESTLREKRCSRLEY